MGRIKTMMIKRNVNELLVRYRNKFGKDFEKNKSVLMEIAEIPSKKIRNIIAGSITKNIKSEK